LIPQGETDTVSRMKNFQDETILSVSPEQAADAVVQVAAQVMRDFREEVRRRPTHGLTLTQLKALGYLKAGAGSSLSDVAEWLGLGAPTTSKVIDELVQQEMVARETDAEDRRRVTLHITPRGRRSLQSVREPAVQALAQRLAVLSDDERAAVARAVELLQPLFGPGGACGREDEA
jgi:DNA-binding MarR family transcriptional regulator